MKAEGKKKKEEEKAKTLAAIPLFVHAKTAHRNG